MNYERALECLEDFNNTINIHVYNYQEKLLQIGKKSQLLTDDLTTFKFFIDRTCRYFQEQIKGDLGYFKHGTDLIKIAVELETRRLKPRLHERCPPPRTKIRYNLEVLKSPIKL